VAAERVIVNVFVEMVVDGLPKNRENRGVKSAYREVSDQIRTKEEDMPYRVTEEQLAGRGVNAPFAEAIDNFCAKWSSISGGSLAVRRHVPRQSESSHVEPASWSGVSLPWKKPPNTSN